MNLSLIFAELENIWETKYTWQCEKEKCDGKPHDEYNYSHARWDQRTPEGNWDILLYLCGRGWGKTRTGSELFLDLFLETPLDIQGRPTTALITGRTHEETIKILLKGVSSLKYAFERRNILPLKQNPNAPQWWNWNKVDKEITLWTGQRISIAYAEGNEDLGRGQEFALVWVDELGTFKKIKTGWEDALQPAVRAKLPDGKNPRILITTTPKAESVEAFKIMKDIVKQSQEPNSGVVLVKGTTWANLHNLTEKYVAYLERNHPVGTRSRKQELEAELLDNVEGALWTAELIDSTRIKKSDLPVEEEGVFEWTREIVSVDPATTSGPKSDFTGIARLKKGVFIDGDEKEEHVYLMEEMRLKTSPDIWAEKVVEMAYENECDILIETDQGGEAWKTIIANAARKLGVMCPAIHERTATGQGNKGKRATPLNTAFYNGEAHIVGGLPYLEDEMTTWDPDSTRKSPDMIDAFAHGYNHLIKEPELTLEDFPEMMSLY